MSNQQRSWPPAAKLFEPTAPKGYSYERSGRGPTRHRPLEFTRMGDAEYASITRRAITFEREIELATDYQLKVMNTGCYTVVSDYLAEILERLLLLDYLVKSIQARTIDLFSRAPFDKQPNARSTTTRTSKSDSFSGLKPSRSITSHIAFKSFSETTSAYCRSSTGTATRPAFAPCATSSSNILKAPTAG